MIATSMTRPAGTSAYTGAKVASHGVAKTDFKSALNASKTDAVQSQSQNRVATINAGLGFDFDFGFDNISHSQAEYNAYYAAGAAKISASQGLLPGQYDLTNVSAQQLHIIVNDMIVNQRKSPDDVMGLQMVINNATWTGDINSASATIATDTIDVISKQSAFETARGNGTAAKLLEESLSEILKIHAKSIDSTSIDIASLTSALKSAAQRAGVSR